MAATWGQNGRTFDERARIDAAHSSRERGATAVFVAISLLGLIPMTAFAFHFGRICMERSELQLGADAAALRVASDCAHGLCDAAYDETAAADEYADLSATDGEAAIWDIDLDLASQEIFVRTATEQPNGAGPPDNYFDTIFAPIVATKGSR